MNACGVAMVAFVRGPTVSQARNPHGTFDMVEITIVAVNLGRGFQPTPPLTRFTLFKTKEAPV